MKDFDRFSFLGGFVIGLLIVCVLMLIMKPDLGISQETADEICKQITGNQTAIAKTKYDKNYCKNWKDECKLICETPSFDSTQNIVVRSNDLGWVK